MPWKFGNTESGLLGHLIENPELAKGAAMGATLRLLILRPSSILKGAVSAVIGVVGAMAFGLDLAGWSGMSVQSAAAITALAVDALVKRLLEWVRKGRLPIIGGRDDGGPTHG